MCFEVRLAQPDGVGYYAYAQSLVVRGDLSIADELMRWGVRGSFAQLTHLGHTRNLFATGTALLWLPFVAVAHLILSIASALGAHVRADGYAAAYLHAVNLGSCIYAFLALVLCYRVASRFFAPDRAMWATVAVWTLSPLWQYSFFDGACSHATSAFADALFAYLLVGMRGPLGHEENARAPGGWLQLGLSAGLAAAVRWQEIVLSAAVALYLVYAALRRGISRSSAPGLAPRSWEPRPMCALCTFSVGAVAAFLPQMAIWQMQFGTPLALPQGAAFLRLEHPVPLSVLFSSYHGLYSWTPVVLFATTLGLPLVARRDRWIGTFALGCFILQVFVNSAVLDPGAGVSYGARRFIGLTVFYVLGLAALFTRLPRALGLALTLGLALWTLPLWLSFHEGFIDRVHYVTSAQLVRGALRALQHLPKSLANVGLHALDTVQRPAWLAFSMGSWLVIAIGATLVVALRTPPAGARPGHVTRWALVVAVLDAVVLLAAARTEPAPVAILREGSAAMLDFGWYANSRYDTDPFEPDPWSFAALPGLHAGTLAWGTVPFDVLPPAGDSRFAPSVVTTCYQPTARFTIALEPRPTRSVHLALAGVVGPAAGIAVVTIRVEYQDGTAETRTLQSGRDVWDFFAATPRERVVYAENGSITGYSLPLDSRRLPARMVVSNPPSRPPLLPCSTLFAATQELELSDQGVGGSRFVPVDISAVANANHAREPFRPAFTLNHFPDLAPGKLHFRNVAFLVLDRRATPSGETVISTAWAHGYRVRIPLVPAASKGIAFLLDAALMLSGAAQLADFSVEYDRGPRSVFHIRSGRDVQDYWLSAPSERAAWRGRGAQDLTFWEMPLDVSRIPRYLWISGASKRSSQALAPGVAVFAITQQLEHPK